MKAHAEVFDACPMTAGGPAGDHAAMEKVIAGLQARAALRGHELVALSDGTFIAKRWNLMRELTTIAEVEAWLGRIEGKRA
jgi:hypothetical protein